MGSTIVIFNRSQRRFSGLKLPDGKSFDLDSGKTIELDEKTAGALLKQYPRDLVKASEARPQNSDFTAKAGELAKREEAVAKKEAELAKREEAVEKAEKK